LFESGIKQKKKRKVLKEDRNTATEKKGKKVSGCRGLGCLVEKTIKEYTAGTRKYS